MTSANRWAARASLLVLTLTLAACGGGGGSVGSTPAPTPTSPTPSPSPAPTPMPTPTPTPTPTPVATNDDLISPLVTESFANTAILASGSFPKDGSAPTLATAPETATIRYDNNNQSYTVTAGARTQTFRSTDIDLTLSDPTVTTYVRQSGSVADSLVLTKPGTSGRFTYQYVGGAYWQNTVDGLTNVTGAIDAITYGVRTAGPVAPVSGRAEYQLDVIGAQTNAGTVVGIRGDGTLQIDFNRNLIRIEGKFGSGTFSNMFNGVSTMSTSGAVFSGGFGVNLNGTNLPGGFSGSFYGPNSQEVGLTFSVIDPGGHQTAVGSMLGRGGAISYETFDPSKAIADQAGLSATYGATAAATGGTATARNLPLEVRYNSATSTYTLVNSERSVSAPLNTDRTFILDTDVVAANSSSFSYLTPMRWLRTKLPLPGSSGLGYEVTHFINGTLTPNTSVPRTGRAGYAMMIDASAGGSAFATYGAVSGAGRLYADFATGALDVSGFFTLAGEVTGSTPYFKDFTGTAQLSSSANSFIGTLSFQGVKEFTGSWSGHLYGSDASEVGSAFTLTDSSNNVISGIMIGQQKAELTATYVALTDLPGPKAFPHQSSYVDTTTTRYDEGVAVTFDPKTGTYSMRNDLAVYAIPEISFGSAEKDSVKSNATYTYFTKTLPLPNGPDTKVEIVALNPGVTNPTLKLSYVSFVDLHFFSRNFNPSTGNFDISPDSGTHYTSVFGQNTPTNLTPISGKGTYSGVAIGDARTSDSVNGIHSWALTGTTSISVNFTARSMTGTIALTGVDRRSAAARDFGSAAFSGDLVYQSIGDSLWLGTFSNGSGQLKGGFFGPQGVELGGTFNMERSVGGEQQKIAGAIVAARTP